MGIRVHPPPQPPHPPPPQPPPPHPPPPVVLPQPELEPWLKFSARRMKKNPPTIIMISRKVHFSIPCAFPAKYRAAPRASNKKSPPTDVRLVSEIRCRTINIPIQVTRNHPKYSFKKSGPDIVCRKLTLRSSWLPPNSQPCRRPGTIVHAIARRGIALLL